MIYAGISNAATRADANQPVRALVGASDGESVIRHAQILDQARRMVRRI
jgi:hypothetical protein